MFQAVLVSCDKSLTKTWSSYRSFLATETISRLFFNRFTFTDRFTMPLGMQDRRILPSRLRASSSYNYNYGPDRGRLNQFAAHSRTGGWMAQHRNRNQWYQIDLGQMCIVKGIATQGRRGAHYWVKTYQLSYSRLGAQFKTFVSFGRVKVNKSYFSYWSCFYQPAGPWARLALLSRKNCFKADLLLTELN